ATLTDMLGRQVHRQVISAESESATITPPANLPSGMYLLQIQQGQTIQQTRILKQ
ncbi:MAG: T9SS type A sorting domain-containing protein, partial [Chitinophagaceae bacterium]